MTYQQWFKEHSYKHQNILIKCQHLNDDEIIRYFEFENMVAKEPDFCLLYKTNTKCHDIKKLNCYSCGCPHFRLHQNHSSCDISSKKAKYYTSNDGFKHLDCSNCTVPHHEKYVKKYFDRSWMSIMANVIQY